MYAVGLAKLRDRLGCVIGNQNDFGEGCLHKSQILQKFFGGVGNHVDIGHEARRSQSLSAQLAPFHDSLCEVVMSQSNASLLRGLRYGVMLAAASWSCDRQNTRLSSAQKLHDLREGHHA